MRPPKKVHNWDDLPVALSVNDTAIILDISTDYVTLQCRQGKLPAKQIGRSWYIDRNKLRAMLGQGAPSPAPCTQPDQIEAIAQRVAELVLAQLKGASA